MTINMPTGSPSQAPPLESADTPIEGAKAGAAGNVPEVKTKAQDDTDTEQKPVLRPPIYAQASSLSENLNQLVTSFAGTASLGSAIMAILVEHASQQRKVNKEAKLTQAESNAQEIEKQAKEMKTKAAVQLALAIVSGAISIIGGMVTVKGVGSALKSGLKGEALGAATTKIGGQQTAFSGVSGILGAVSENIGTMSDATVKKMDAEIERGRQNVENLKDFNDALNDLISKLMAAAQSIEESSNQARTKIMA
ncbi:MAG: type III secretion system translocon subunit SctB [Deltaproteobacteria bacterium]|jgi:hypothetical protein|nr:type III secretion system translocon subunit SctB [Deltaproteobacteria bacterium]